MGKLNRGPGLIDADHFALHKPVVVAQLYDLRQGEVGPQLPIFRPGNIEHPCWLKMCLEFGEQVIELFLAFCKKVDVIKCPASFVASSSFNGLIASTASFGAFTRIARAPSRTPIFSDASPVICILSRFPSNRAIHELYHPVLVYDLPLQPGRRMAAV